MLSNHNMAGQSMIFPPRIHECMRTSLYVRQRHCYHCHCCQSCGCIIYLTLIFNFFLFYQNGPLLGILIAQNIHQLPVI